MAPLQVESGRFIPWLRAAKLKGRYLEGPINQQEAPKGPRDGGKGNIVLCPWPENRLPEPLIIVPPETWSLLTLRVLGLGCVWKC